MLTSSHYIKKSSVTRGFRVTRVVTALVVFECRAVLTRVTRPSTAEGNAVKANAASAAAVKTVDNDELMLPRTNGRSSTNP